MDNVDRAIKTYKLKKNFASQPKGNFPEELEDDVYEIKEEMREYGEEYLRKNYSKEELLEQSKENVKRARFMKGKTYIQKNTGKSIG